ncbi:MAG: hypothetical protein BJ554DRAFT_1880 [Olpidium bornovanus]|uniref:Ribosomal protein L37 n=1 Tax=Olpidium bornovanus TaxID=278681 RepID=A0A8H7ZR21_9FUNG|nr:MAG: hypothetical protein BJ554DRAFT_1880 [Olpidium bornovanus]
MFPAIPYPPPKGARVAPVVSSLPAGPEKSQAPRPTHPALDAMLSVSSSTLSRASRPLLQLFAGRRPPRAVPSRTASSEPALAVAEDEEPAFSPESRDQPDLPENRPSIAPAGTVLTGLNYIAGEKEYVAREDDKYPKWLWTLEGERASKAAQADPTKRNFYQINRKRDIVFRLKEQKK